MKILITRPEPEATELSQWLQAEGVETTILPLLKISYTPFLLNTTHRLIFVSKNAVAAYTGPTLTQACFAVGQSTAEALQQKGFKQVIYPANAQGSEALLQLPELQDIAGQVFTIICGNDSRNLLAETLMARGAKVHKQIVYRSDVIKLSQAELNRLKAPYDLIIVTSSHALRYLAELARTYHPAVFKIPVTVLAENMLESALHLGFDQPVVMGSFQNQQILKEYHESLRH